MRFPVALVIGLAALAASADAAAQQGREPPRPSVSARRPVVILVRPAGASPVIDEMLGRTRAELVASGFDTRIIEGSPGQDPRDAIEAADADAIAAIAVVDPQGEATVEVWVDDRLSGKVSIRPLVADEVDDHKAAAVLAIQAVELLRASLVEIAGTTLPEDDPKAPPARVAPPAAVAFARGPDTPPRSRAELALSAGPTAFVGFDPATVHVAPALALALTAPSGLGGRVRWIGPSLAPNLEVEEGELSASAWLLTAGALFAPRTSSRLFGFAAVDAGVFRLSATGLLDAPAVGRGGSSLAAGFLAGGGGGLRLTGQVALVAEAQLLFTAPRVNVQVGGDEVLAAGRPWGVIALGLQLAR